MQREIKFRAWCEQLKKFHYFNEFIACNDSDDDFWMIGEPDDWNDFRYYCEHKEFEQYVGLKDRNGKEIYENDIVVCRDMHDDNIDDNAWVSKDGRFEARPFVIECPSVIKWKIPPSLIFTPTQWEVIGNVHQHPELLTK